MWAVMSNLTTLLRVQMDTVFSSLDTLRHKSDAPAEQDDLEVGAAFFRSHAHSLAVG